MWLSELTGLCWNCDRPIWFCRGKYVLRDIGWALLVGFPIGGAVGAVAALIHNLFFSPFGRWS